MWQARARRDICGTVESRKEIEGLDSTPRGNVPPRGSRTRAGQIGLTLSPFCEMSRERRGK